MDEVQGPVVAIAFVLAAVFVPVAFLGGMTGVLYKQFALTIAISMALSAFVALTLTPALCAMILKPHASGESTGLHIFDRFFAWFNEKFELTKNLYVWIVASFIDFARYSFLLLVIVSGLMVFFYMKLPSTFVPEEDQGYFMTSVSLPEGPSMNHTVECPV